MDNGVVMLSNNIKQRRRRR